MQFLAIIAALLASSAFTVLAAPAPEKQSPADNCPNGWYYCGVWNYFFLSFFSYLYYADRKKKTSNTSSFFPSQVCNGTSCRMYEFN